MRFKCCYNKKITQELKKTVDFLKIISDQNRVRILCLLKSGAKCVCEIWPDLNLPQNLISHHLKILKEAKLLKSKKQGQKIYYELNQEGINKQLDVLNIFLKPNKL